MDKILINFRWNVIKSFYKFPNASFELFRKVSDSYPNDNKAYFNLKSIMYRFNRPKTLHETGTSSFPFADIRLFGAENAH